MYSILESRSKSSGLAQRTLKNLEFIENAQKHGNADVHLVTQVVNSLLALLVFPIQSERHFFSLFRRISLPSSVILPQSMAQSIQTKINQTLNIPTLRIRKFGDCPNMARFFKRLRNALSHKNIEFDSESLDLSLVTVTLRDQVSSNSPVDWEITMSAKDLREIGLYLGDEIVKRGL